MQWASSTAMRVIPEGGHKTTAQTHQQDKPAQEATSTNTPFHSISSFPEKAPAVHLIFFVSRKSSPIPTPQFHFYNGLFHRFCREARELLQTPPPSSLLPSPSSTSPTSLTTGQTPSTWVQISHSNLHVQSTQVSERPSVQLRLHKFRWCIFSLDSPPCLQR